ncbi:acetyl-CoA carboxylase biotin carboxyl carrier protein [Oikeobacillus pervagus]|uniref:Biotin carboxyl carrier protein of acetyl-CoA carboxylase n=1 Tax=Oikeobacillus pervagus TaxID=1325931 RepID=A0AAJ1WHZ0_9BACI|nr:acetyl-CoA carboxylase biotin carboxyl carrier protein [Oikeobacillus pervagus]MDQ0213828.1 acetyl-CoA carboxylase biotin carboxyl carrier protein [Oikeobacillus pervagus]
MKVQEIRELIKLIDQSSLDELVVETDGSKVKMKKRTGVTYVEQEPVQQVVQEAKAPAASAPVAKPAVEKKVEEAPKAAAKVDVDDANLHKITSPMVGTFYQSPSPDEDAYVKVGSKVSEESVVCIVEAMKLFNEIEAEVEGEIVEVLVKDGQLVEYGQPLFLVKPE